MNFIYVQDDKSVRITLADDSDPFSDFGSYRPFSNDVVSPNTYSDGTVNDDGSITFSVYNYQGNVYDTLAFALNS